MPDALPDKATVAWYHTPVAVLIVFLAVGPFVLPLLWTSPAFKTWQKAACTAIIALFTAWMLKASADMYHIFLKQAQELRSVVGK